MSSFIYFSRITEILFYPVKEVIDFTFSICPLDTDFTSLFMWCLKWSRNAAFQDVTFFTIPQLWIHTLFAKITLIIFPRAITHINSTLRNNSAISVNFSEIFDPKIVWVWINLRKHPNGIIFPFINGIFIELLYYSTLSLANLVDIHELAYIKLIN